MNGINIAGCLWLEEPKEPLMAKFLAAIVRGFKNFFNFSGRASAREYWYFILAMFIADFINGLVVSNSSSTHISWWIFFIPAISAGVRRMHDCGRNGLWILFPILNIFLLCGKADDGINKYGPPSPPLG